MTQMLIFFYKKQVNKKKKNRQWGSIKSAVDEKSEKEIDLPREDKFSYNLATILARDREVVAVNLRVLSNGYSRKINVNIQIMENFHC
ncbi:hypothetical protein RhiirA5_15165 [Rhizophagus irregularis]|uniref:Uncharacterized protein n=1 Tax=Rhizophagus irregularis TaxID=588596 RepID=A0A2N1NYW3_9GLOM|nr:hypothetical protein RhiirA5_15165 [Rhizophagus irregularis]PKK79066.1 hypothetical protein RhiirC2_450130 [Rhizophagus irregularis]GET61426.1 hypothetical protein GLOIN_2v1796042 [Rhizophagus irregularis DAOM 181602=DAOM 197198]